MADRLTGEQVRAAAVRLRRIVMDQKPYATVLAVPGEQQADAVNRRRLEAIGRRMHAPDQRGGHRG